MKGGAMPSPFPGMDPYIERPEIWPDFQMRLVVFISRALLLLLRPRYLTLIQHRRFMDESPWHEERRQSYVQVIQPAAGNRVVTAIEVLSPDNKVAGSGRVSYLQKREEFWAAGTNLVEIDLLRAGQPTVRLSAEQMAKLGPWTYLVAATRRWPSRHEVYAFPLPHRLPRVLIPLAEDDKDVVLDLQAAFTRCWDEGPYPELLRYEGPPPGTLTADQVNWCVDALAKAGFRPTPPAP
jgi:hypothetical protein